MPSPAIVAGNKLTKFLGATEIVKLLYTGIDLALELNCQYS